MKSREFVLSAEEAWRLFELLEELNQFVHQPGHYREPEQIEKWLASGVADELRHAYYRIASKWFQPDPESGRVFPPPGVSRRFPE
jgi:hypothetical protein